MNEILMEGFYEHYKDSVIKDLSSQFNNAIQYLTDLIVNYESFNLNDIFEDLKKDGFQRWKDGSIYKTLKFRPKSKFLVDANKKIPLGVSFTISVQPDDMVRKATYQRNTGLISLSIDFLEGKVNEYNSMLAEARKLAPTLSSYKNLKRLQDLREEMLYYIDPYLTRSTLVHEMTHWLDNVYDNDIFDGTYDTDKWIWIKSEINAILHQAEYLYSVVNKKKWSEMTIIDILVLIRIRRDFLGAVMQEYLKKSKGSWISNFLQLMKERGIPVSKLKKDNDFKNYYQMDLLGDRDNYKNYYYFLRRNAF